MLIIEYSGKRSFSASFLQLNLTGGSCVEGERFRIDFAL